MDCYLTQPLASSYGPALRRAANNLSITALVPRIRLRRMNSSKRLALAVLIATATTVTVAQDRVPQVPGIDVAGMDLSVRPQDDFFRYVNGKWADNTPIPADQSGYGSFAMLRERAQERVRVIIEEESRKPSAPGSTSQKVGDFYKSFMDESKIESLGIAPLKGELAAIAAITDKKDLPKAFARASQAGVRLPFSVGVGPDQRDSQQYAVQITQSGLGMPDRDYYLRNDERFAATRKAYTTYIARLFALGSQPDPEGAAARITSLETTIAKLQWDRARNRDRNLTYNKMGVKSLQATMPTFDWKAFLAEMPADADDKVTEVIVRQPDYLKSIDAVIAEVPLATWKEYLTFGLISAYADGLSQPFVDSDFEFNGKVIAGRQVLQPRWKRAVNGTEQTLGEPIGRLYVERHFKPEAKARMDALIRNLRAAFEVMIDELEWMSPATKVEAKAKLAKFRVKIAYPDQWRDFSDFDVKPGDHVGNLLRYREFQAEDAWSRLGKPVERWRWGFTPQTVNASYSATSNEITFPAGILQPPFFDLDADDAINYGAIGAVRSEERRVGKECISRGSSYAEYKRNMQ